MQFIDNVFLFLATVVAISTTGVMMPGPVTAATIAKGYKSRWAGIHIALGHGLVEFPTIALMALGFSTVLKDFRVAIIIGLAGGTMLVYMGTAMITSREGVVAKLKGSERVVGPEGRKKGASKGQRAKAGKGKGKAKDEGKDDPFPYHPLIAGVMTTASNPYYFLWWATLGAALTMNAIEFGLVVLVIFAVLHWSIDLGWDFFIGYAVNRSKRFWDNRVYITVFGICGAIMVFFGIWFIGSAVRTIIA